MNYLAQTPPFGTVAPPPGVNRFAGGSLSGLPLFLNIILKTLIVGAAIFSLFNFLLAGYAFISAGNDSQKIQNAWAKIWQTIMGLLLAAGAFVIAAIIGLLIFGDANALLQVRIFAP